MVRLRPGWGWLTWRVGVDPGPAFGPELTPGPQEPAWLPDEALWSQRPASLTSLPAVATAAVGEAFRTTPFFRQGRLSSAFLGGVPWRLVLEESCSFHPRDPAPARRPAAMLALARAI